MGNPNINLNDMSTAEILASIKQKTKLEAATLEKAKAISIDDLTNDMETVANAIKSQESSNNFLAMNGELETFGSRLGGVENNAKDTAIILYGMQQNNNEVAQELLGVKTTTNDLNNRVDNMESAHINTYNKTAVSYSNSEEKTPSTEVITADSVRELTPEELGPLMKDYYYLLSAKSIDGKNVYPQGTCPNGFVQGFQDGTQKSCVREKCNFKDSEHFVEFTFIGEADQQSCTQVDL